MSVNPERSRRQHSDRIDLALDPPRSLVLSSCRLPQSGLGCTSIGPAGQAQSRWTAAGVDRTMRLWSLHPRYLDPRGLVAVWREGLLARAVLRGKSRGYRRHPQLARFRDHESPVLAINSYLAAIADEADSRGYRFDRSRAGPRRSVAPIPLTVGQLSFEVGHLRKKLTERYPEGLRALADGPVLPHPDFLLVPGPVAEWERRAV